MTLLCCPFCGSAPNSALRQSHDEFGEVEYAYHEIECADRACGVLPLVNENLEADDGDNAWQKAFERAANAWNTRANSHTELMDALKACAKDIAFWSEILAEQWPGFDGQLYPALNAARAAIAAAEGKDQPCKS